MDIVRRSYAAAATGGQEPISLDYLPMSTITAVVVPGTGADTYAVQVTLDEIFDIYDPQFIAPASARWVTVTGAPTTATGYITFDGPWRAIRLNPVANTTGILFQVAQATDIRS